MSVRLYVGNLPKENVERDQLAEVFAEEGQQVSTKVIKNRKTGKCRGFAFVTVPNDEVADQFIEKYNGQSFMENPLKIEKALPRNKKSGDEAGTASTTEASNNPPTKKSKGSSNKRSKKSSGTQQQGSVQPDPRWADELAKLKEMLASADR
ncbi:RNA recognition motif domain-containing protein [Myxosarcina sp. GI1(2024)]